MHLLRAEYANELIYDVTVDRSGKGPKSNAHELFEKGEMRPAQKRMRSVESHYIRLVQFYSRMEFSGFLTVLLRKGRLEL